MTNDYLKPGFGIYFTKINLCINNINKSMNCLTANLLSVFVFNPIYCKSIKTC